MAVSEAVRKAEAQIDKQIQQLPLWRCQKSAVVRALLDFYRDATEMAMLATVWVAQNDCDVAVPMLLHSRWQTGVFWALKWALVFCPEESDSEFTPKMILEAQQVGAYYELFVDALRMAQQ